MTTAHTFNGPDGMARKIRLLASNCETATAELSRTLLIAASAPDPVSTPDCEHADPRGIRIQTLDKGMTSGDIAVLMGTLYGMLDTIEHEYAREFGDGFREAVDEARGTHGHGQRMAVVPIVPMDTKPWQTRVNERGS
tara:strand:- start:11270 stop:11683 length:414 start_codon:yes stop_codon:yes gene_type:complete